MRKIGAIFLIFAIFFAAFAQNAGVICSPTPSSIRIAGLVSSPIRATAFVSSNCPSCRDAVVLLYEMANFAYRGVFSVSIKPLYRQLGDIAVVAANNQDRSWDLFHAFANAPATRITADNIDAFFEEAQINIPRIYEDMKDSARIFSILKDNYEDSQRCGLAFTPHILFDGVSFDGGINAREMSEFLDAMIGRQR